MNKTTKWLVGLVAVLVVANIALVATIWLKKQDATAQPAARGDARDYLISSLSLNNAQVKSFDSLRKEHFERMRGYQNGMHRLKDALFEQLKWPRNAQADSLAKKIGDLQATIDLETFEHFSQLRNLLNSQQSQKFDSTIQEVLRTMAPGGPRPPRPGGGIQNPGDRMGPPDEGPPPPGDAPPHS